MVPTGSQQPREGTPPHPPSPVHPTCQPPHPPGVCGGPGDGRTDGRTDGRFLKRRLLRPGVAGPVGPRSGRRARAPPPSRGRGGRGGGGRVTPPTRDRGDLRVGRGGPGPGHVAPRGTGGPRGGGGGGGGGGRGGPGAPAPSAKRNRKSSERTVQRKLRESFAVPRLLVNGLAVFLIELVRFLGETVVQVLAVGLLTAIGDHILKPFLAAAFDSLLQPLLLFLLKVLCGIRDLTDPLVDVLAGVCSQLTALLRAVRLVEINLQPDRRTDLGEVGSG
ncbi:uncharacterized protein M6G45_004039 [Spheniscus humboldti]